IQTNSNHTNLNDSICERFRENWSLELWIWGFREGLQSYRVSGFESARLTIGGLPAWRPAPGIIVPRRGIESKPGDYGEGVAFACINRYPLSTAAFPITAELG